MTFRIRGLDPEPFAPLFGLSDTELQARNVRRIRIEDPHSAPCRISLDDAEPGEDVLLLSYQHQPACSPFQSSGPIFVRPGQPAAFDATGMIPPALARRTLSARAYDAEAMMLEGALCEGADLAPLLEAWLARPQIEVVHLHYAPRGCFLALAERG